MKSRMLMILAVVLGWSMVARADAAHAQALSTLLKSFQELDAGWTAYNSDTPPDPAQRKAFASLLRTHAKSLSKASSHVNGMLRVAFRDCADVLRDVSDNVTDPTASPEHELDTPDAQLAFLPIITQGVVAGLIELSAGPARLTPQEVQSFRTASAEAFGTRMKGAEAVNGDTPFVQSISFIDGFLSASGD